MIESIISNIISTILSDAVKGTRLKREWSDYFDYLLVDEKGEKIAIEILSKSLLDKKIETLYDTFIKHGKEINKLLVVTRYRPEEYFLNQFYNLFRTEKIDAKLITLNELQEVLGLEGIGDLNNPQNINKLQTRSLINDFSRYSDAPIGLIETPEDFFEHFKQDEITLNLEYKILTRQFSKRTVFEFYKNKKNLNEIFNFGKRSNDVTIVLSDIKNFSSLVKTSNPNILNEIMRKYYTKSRKLVFDNNGMLDKFIGDAVLAVFGFPFPDEDSIKNAIKFSKELIQLGNSLFPDLLFEINEYIETGTRVGMANGEVWALNIGDDFPEITLVGDTINLAARLEKNSAINGILMNNKTRTKIIKMDPLYAENLNLDEKIIEPHDAKGQLLPIRGWQMF